MKRASRLVLAAFLLSLSAPAAYACSCADFSVRQKFRAADAVFVGKVLELSPTQPSEDFPLAMYLVKFEVEKSWKGGLGREVMAVADFDMPAMCGDLKLAVGESYLIYAPRKKGRLQVLTDCGPNRNVKDAGEEMKRLGRFRLRLLAGLYPFPKL